jgi:hypothetical protein
MGPRNAIDLCKPWFEKAFAEHLPDETLLWGLGMITLVDPQPLDPNRPKPVSPEAQVNANPFVTSIVLHIEAPGVVEGTHLATDVLMNMSAITPEHADRTIRDLAEKLPAQRARQQASLGEAKAGRAPSGGRLEL